MKKLAYKDIKISHPDLFDNSNASIKIISDDDEISSWKKQKLTELKEQGNSPVWADVGVVLDDPRVVALRDLVEFPSGFRNGYIRLYNRAYLEGGAAAVVMLPEKDGNILLIQHFRHATRMHHWEIPRGFGMPGVNAETQAKNELREEIGGEVAELVDLGVFYNNTGLEGHPVNLFLAHLDSVGEMEVEEGIENSRWVSAAQLERMIADQEITDGFTIVAYTRAKLKGRI